MFGILNILSTFDSGISMVETLREELFLYYMFQWYKMKKLDDSRTRGCVSYGLY